MKNNINILSKIHLHPHTYTNTTYHLTSFTRSQNISSKNDSTKKSNRKYAQKKPKTKRTGAVLKRRKLFIEFAHTHTYTHTQHHKNQIDSELVHHVLDWHHDQVVVVALYKGVREMRPGTCLRPRHLDGGGAPQPPGRACAPGAPFSDVLTIPDFECTSRVLCARSRKQFVDTISNLERCNSADRNNW